MWHIHVINNEKKRHTWHFFNKKVTCKLNTMTSNFSQNRIEKIPRSDGLNLFYKISAVSLLSSMSRFPSINLVSSLTQINKVLKSFEDMLTNNLNQPIFAGPVHLTETGLLKKKHYNYGAYLAALSSFPILHRFNKNYIFDPYLQKRLR